MPLRTFLARAARFIERAWTPQFDVPPPPSPLWQPQVGERVWCIQRPAPHYAGFDAPVVIDSIRSSDGYEFTVRSEDPAMDPRPFWAFLDELSPINAAEDMVEAMRRLSAEVARS